MLKSKLNVGSLDRRIIIQSVTRTKDVYNQDIETWSTFATVRASVDRLGGNESYQADQKTEVQLTTFVIRYLSGLSETMRILYNERLYDVKSIQYPDRDRMVIIKAEILDET